MKNKKVLIVIFLFIVGIFSISISTDNFFFTTKYYKTPIEAYNSDGTYHAIYGDTSAKKEVGLILLDNKTCLFIGEIDNNNFVVSELDVKKDKYSSRGMRYYYDINEVSYTTDENVTKISNGIIKWGIYYNKSQAESVSNAFSIKSFALSNENEFYLVLVEE